MSKPLRALTNWFSVGYGAFPSMTVLKVLYFWPSPLAKLITLLSSSTSLCMAERPSHMPLNSFKYASSRHFHISLAVEHPTMRYMLSSVIVAEIQLLRSTSFSSQSTVVFAPSVADELLVSGLPSLIKFVTFIT
ncbi:PREDICTED: uncharacterized protein LOC109217283 [Nicotiana attenuata]|uniref:uncharacterized protein LOC109217283 n=1 Tax=Nicotiana attenuata TaxID=49451 RepID=UPI0009049F4B|nr:PREDICTED: uncharacterized protein LOC109217283 [Nicotiana attenuata]